MSAIQKHTQWLRSMQDQGWSCGDTYDAAAKKHPQMKPWENLTQQEQANFVTTGDHDWSAGIAPDGLEGPDVSQEELDREFGDQDALDDYFEEDEEEVVESIVYAPGEAPPPEPTADELDHPAPEPDHNG